MKKILIILVLFFATFTMFGQANKGLNFGVGLNTNSGLPVYASYDFPVAANISVAPSIQFNLNGLNWITPSVKADYYFDELLGIPSTFDFYGGLNVGFSITFNDNKDKSGLYLGAEIGGRWWFKENMGLNLEFAGGTGFGTKLGLSMKM